MPRLGLLGCGNIGGIIARHEPAFDFVAVYDREEDRARRLASRLDATACASIEDFLAHDFDIVVEAASVEALRSHGEAILEAGKDLVALSVGALAETEFRQRLTTLARQRGRRIRIPSGALFGLDNLKIGRISRLDELLLRTTKSPKSLNLEATERRLLFRGTASDCIRDYPKNVNVAVALSLAADREATVELWVDPETDRNTHEVLVRGEFGDAELRVANLPCPDNPATSYLAALSVLSLLTDLDTPLVVGT
ncbi:MAG: aspartate dehydrogenase [Pseudomonadota bacterium]